MGRLRLLLLWTKAIQFLAFDSEVEVITPNDPESLKPQQKLEPWQQCQTFMAPSGEGLGWGVFAARSFQAGEIVELSPGIIPVESGSPVILDSALFDYAYGYYRVDIVPARRPSVHHLHAVMLGMGMIFNHHPVAPNLDYTTFGREPASDVPHAANAIGFVARRDIAIGEELFSTYGKEDGGKDWFSRRGMKPYSPGMSERRISVQELPSIIEQYCSKIAAGLGRHSWENRIQSLLPPPPGVPFWMDARWLPPNDGEIGSAYAKVAIRAGENIEMGTGMILSRSRHLKGTALADLAMNWEVLQADHQRSLRVLRDQGQLKLQHNTWLTEWSWNRTDGFTLWEDVAILPIGGNIGLVDRRSFTGVSSHNCRLEIPTTSDSWPATHDHVVVALVLIATQDIQPGELLRLNIPYSSTQRKGVAGRDEVAILHEELKAMGRLPPENTRYGIKTTQNREEL